MQRSQLLRDGIVLVMMFLPASSARAIDPGARLVPPELFTLSDPDLAITVWATSPQLKNPTNLDFDGDGRVWVAEGVNYRRHYNRQPEGDRIMVLADTDRDGRADESTVFVQEPFLRAPMGIAVIGNRVVVSMAPDLIVYTDVNRDRRFDPAVDKREVILTGFNGRVHDHTVHSVTVGPDGQWYFNAGNCGALLTDKSGRTFRIGSPYDPYYGSKPSGDLGWDPREIAGQRSDDGHVYIGGFAARMNPDGTGLAIIGHNFRNSYEQTVNAYGDVFQNDNDDPPACRTAFLLEYGNAGFASTDGRRSWQADRRPGQSVPVAEWRQEDPGTMPAGDVYGGGSPTGIAWMDASALGKKYRGLLLSCEPGRNVVFGYLPKPDGAGFRLDRFDFLTSNPEQKYAGGDFKGGDRSVSSEVKTLFRPSDVGVGPDGAVYVADFFDPRVGGHNDMDDSLSGTIYRIAPKGFKGRAPRLELGTLKGALAGLRSPAVNVRGAALEAVKAHGAAAVRPVARLLKDEDSAMRGRAVWLLSLLGPAGLEAVLPVLQHPEPALRLTAFRALRRLNHEVLAHARTLAGDPSPAVRREVALALRDVSWDNSADLLMALARGFDGRDRTYLEALGTGASGKEAALYLALKSAWGMGDPMRWNESFAWIAWRLHPAEGIGDFRMRARSATLSDLARRVAITALGQNGDAAAADAMLDVATQATRAADQAVRTEAVWWLLNRKDSLWKAHGLAAQLQRTGLYDPDNVELISATIPEPEPSRFPSPGEIGRLRGDARRGSEAVKVCHTCHRIGDVGTEYAPNLTGWARRQTLEVFLQSVINPSADIAHGYGGTQVTTKDGVEIHGLVVSEGDPLVLQSAAGLMQTVPANRVATRKSLGRSLMLSAEQLGLQPQDLMDIHAYLQTR